MTSKPNLLQCTIWLVQLNIKLRPRFSRWKYSESILLYGAGQPMINLVQKLIYHKAMLCRGSQQLQGKFNVYMLPWYSQHAWLEFWVSLSNREPWQRHQRAKRSCTECELRGRGTYLSFLLMSARYCNNMVYACGEMGYGIDDSVWHCTKIHD